jgi:hypothetical protein
VKSRYGIVRPVVPWRYLGGAAAARAGDEMSGPALLLFGLAATGRPAAGSELVTCLLIAAGTQACAAATYLLTGPGRAGEPVPPPRPEAARSE